MQDLFSVKKPVIGMVHAKPLPGAPLYRGNFTQILEGCLSDAENLVEGGVHGLMLENYGDRPFFPTTVPAVVVASLTAIGCEIRRRFPAVPLGINVLRNDGRSALAVAKATHANFIRVNILTGARLTDQGVIEGSACHLLRERKMLEAESIRILADVNVKHSAPVAPVNLESEVGDLLSRGLADSLIVSGQATGDALDLEELKKVKSLCPETMVWVGSGACPETLSKLSPIADGYIVGTYFKANGKVDNPVDRSRVETFLKCWESTD